MYSKALPLYLQNVYDVHVYIEDYIMHTTAFDTRGIFLLLGYKIKVIQKEVWANVFTQQSFAKCKS